MISINPEQRSDAERGASPRQVEDIYRAPPLHWVGDGFRVAGYFSVIPDAVRRLSPFLLLDYHPKYDYPPTLSKRGVGVHPHRGFETVTLAFEGSVAHHDSAGNGGVIGPGDVQWMTAASGILHKEYHEASFAKAGGTFQMAQLWVNLPRKNKLAPPAYQSLQKSQMGLVTVPEQGLVRVVAGEYRGVRGPARTFTPIDVFHVLLDEGGALDFDFPARNNTAMLVMQGETLFNARDRASENDFVVFENAGGRISVRAGEGGAQLLVLSGEPIDEPVVQYGPFVMNEEREIHQAFVDFSRGKFGSLD